MAAALCQRAQALRVNVPSIDVINEVARQLQEVKQNEGNRAAIEQAFLHLAEGRQWLEYHPVQPHLANRVDGDPVRPPIPQVMEQLVPPDFPPVRFPPIRPGLLDLIAAAAANPVPNGQIPAQPDLLERIYTAVLDVFLAIIDFFKSFFCPAPPKNNAPRVVAPAQQVVQPNVVPAHAAPPPPVAVAAIRAALPQAPPAVPQILGERERQAVGQFTGTQNARSVGAGAISSFCIGTFFLNLWTAVEKRENITLARAQELIDASLRNAVQKREQSDQFAIAFPEIEERALARPNGNYLPHVTQIDLHAIRNAKHLSGAIIGSENNCRLILVDARERRNHRYYFYDPHANNDGLAELHIFEELQQLSNHLDRSIPIDDSVRVIQVMKAEAQ